jgi:AcrR family transcriptional regulator
MRLFFDMLWIVRNRAMTKGEATRERIVAAAAPLFNQRGFAGCSMQDLMEATGLEKGGLYRHFRSKEELAAAAFRYSLGRNVKTRTEQLDELAGAVEKLREMVRRFVERPSAVEGGCPLMNTAVESDDGNAVLRGLALHGIQDWRSRLMKIVEDGVKAGEIRAGTPAKGVANTVIATLEGALMISRLERNKEALRDAQRMLDGVFAGIGVQG